MNLSLSSSVILLFASLLFVSSSSSQFLHATKLINPLSKLPTFPTLPTLSTFPTLPTLPVLPSFVNTLEAPVFDTLGQTIDRVKVNVQPGPPYVESVNNPEYYAWKVCQELPILNLTCIRAYVHVNNLTAGLDLTANGVVLFSQTSPQTKECVNEVTLIELVFMSPELLPLKPVLGQLLKLYGSLPAGMLSVCVVLEQFKLTNEQFSGCVDLNVNIICWQKNCVFKENAKLGCFNLSFGGIPTNTTVEWSPDKSKQKPTGALVGTVGPSR